MEKKRWKMQLHKALTDDVLVFRPLSTDAFHIAHCQSIQ